MNNTLNSCNNIYLYEDFFQNKWKSTKFPRKPMSSKMDQEDENRSPRMPQNQLKAINPQGNSIDESEKT